MRQAHSRFLTDLTTSEGQLHRFTSMCHIVSARGIADINTLLPLIAQQLNLTNEKVARRHLRVMESIGLLAHADDGYVLTSEGKALSALVPSDCGDSFEMAEKVFYLRALSMYVPIQLSSILLAISENPGGPKERAINRYGEQLLSSGMPWKNRDILRAILAGEPESPPRTIRNNFDCFRLWLKQLDLVNGRGFLLTKMGRKLHAIAATGYSNLWPNIHQVASAYVCGERECPEYIDRTDRAGFLELFHKAYTLFERTELRLSNVRSIGPYVCVRILIEQKRVLSEESFLDLVRRLVSEQILQAAMTGRDGKLAYVSLGSAARYLKRSEP